MLFNHFHSKFFICYLFTSSSYCSFSLVSFLHFLLCFLFLFLFLCLRLLLLLLLLQVADYACIYATRASDLAGVSPSRDFRPADDLMPHDVHGRSSWQLENHLEEEETGDKKQ